jgi:hypothetical protein
VVVVVGLGVREVWVGGVVVFLKALPLLLQTVGQQLLL